MLARFLEDFLEICLRVASNKKIRNATSCKLGNITFKSQLEKTVYNCLLEQGFNPQYEPKTFTLIDGFDALTPFYDKETDNQYKKRKELGDYSARKLVKKSRVIQGIRYTPDFYFKYNDLHVFIEAKGLENDVFYIKKKLFIRYLDKQPYDAIYFEVYTKKQLLQAIDIIRNYGKYLEDNTAVNTDSTSEGLSSCKEVS